MYAVIENHNFEIMMMHFYEQNDQYLAICYVYNKQPMYSWHLRVIQMWHAAQSGPRVATTGGL